jgi:hypothetical protein
MAGTSTVTAEELNLIRAERLAIGVDNKRAVDWAVAALLAGVSTPSIVLLAGSSPSAFGENEISDLIDAAATELGAPVIREDCLRLYARQLADAFVREKIPARELVARLRAVSRTLREPRDLACWVVLDEELHLAEEGANNLVEVRRRIIEGVTRLLE